MQLASKDGYQLTAHDQTHFRAVQLTSVQISIRDEQGHPVSGVLTSLSTEGYGSNHQSTAAGTVTVTALRPGSYYIRPLLKEYVFTPATLTQELLEGQMTEVQFVAKRVAFSVFGGVQSLAGQPIADVKVEAFKVP